MSDAQKDGQADATQTRHVSEHLANERTYLAWLRTAVTLMTFGMVLNRFAVEFAAMRRMMGVRRLSTALDAETAGLGMVVAGMLLMVGAAVRYTQVRRHIAAGEYRPLDKAVWVIAGAVLAGGVTCLFWLV